MIESNAPTNGVPPELDDPLLGRVLNERFRILEALGAGGMGRVYKAMQAPLDRVVALKVLNPSYSSTKDPGFQQRFLREASLTSKLRHPNTVTVIDYGQTDDGIFYIAMEYLEGRTLAQVLTQTGPLPWSRVINIAQQVCRSLREAHGIDIVHRDLKPANIILLNESDQDLVKVLDFGLVKSIAPVPEGEGAINPEITQSGTFLGSPQYMAPEQARNVADTRSDIYSLGVVLYQMLQGRPPFVARDHLELIFSHCKEPPPPFNSLRPYLPVPAEIEAVVMRCLEKDPARRFQSMDELLEAMRTAHMAAGGHSGVFKRPAGTTTTGPHASPLFAAVNPPDTNSSTLALDISVEVPEAVARARRRRMMGTALMVLLALGVGGGGAFFMMRPGTAPAVQQPVQRARRPPGLLDTEPALAGVRRIRRRREAGADGRQPHPRGPGRRREPVVPAGLAGHHLVQPLRGLERTARPEPVRRDGQDRAALRLGQPFQPGQVPDHGGGLGAPHALRQPQGEPGPVSGVRAVLVGQFEIRDRLLGVSRLVGRALQDLHLPRLRRLERGQQMLGHHGGGGPVPVQQPGGGGVELGAVLAGLQHRRPDVRMAEGQVRQQAHRAQGADVRRHLLVALVEELAHQGGSRAVPEQGHRLRRRAHLRLRAVQTREDGLAEDGARRAPGRHPVLGQRTQQQRVSTADGVEPGPEIGAVLTRQHGDDAPGPARRDRPQGHPPVGGQPQQLRVEQGGYGIGSVAVGQHDHGPQLGEISRQMEEPLL